MLRCDAEFFARANLVAHVDGGRRVVADQNGRESRRDAIVAPKALDLSGDLALDLRGHARAVELLRFHNLFASRRCLHR